MLLSSPTIDKNIIKVDYTELIKIAYKGSINISLEYR
jgi:hypothetical protein